MLVQSLCARAAQHALVVPRGACVGVAAWRVLALQPWAVVLQAEPWLVRAS